MTATYTPQYDPIHCALCCLERLGEVRYHDRDENGLYVCEYPAGAVKVRAAGAVVLLMAHRDRMPAGVNPESGEWRNFLHHVDQAESAALVSRTPASSCDIGRPLPTPLTGIVATGPGYRLTGDGESSYLAPCEQGAAASHTHWYNYAFTINDLARAVLGKAADTARGRFVITVEFHPDPYAGNECAIYHGRTQCCDGRPWDAPPPDPGALCRRHDDPSPAADEEAS